jgi:hypothetical protein
MDKMCKDNKLKKKIIRAHTLKGEKSEVYKYFDQQHGPQQRYQVSDDFVIEFAIITFLAKLNKETRQVCDPRRVLAHMSLAQALYDTLENPAEPGIQLLRTMLQEYGENGFYKTEPAQRTNIKLALDDLMALTIRSAVVGVNVEKVECEVHNVSITKSRSVL